jgi:hypothetical protein
MRVTWKYRKQEFEAFLMSRTYRYLDGEAERQELVNDIRRVRRSVIQLAESIPEARRYEPRYHGWTLGAMLTHLHIVDQLSMFSMQMALLGLHPPVPTILVNQFNDLTARLFQKRVVETTLGGMRAYEDKIVHLILHLPINKFSKSVYDVASESYITIERALQGAFYYHWQEHLLTLQKGEGIYYEPPERYDTL